MPEEDFRKMVQGALGAHGYENALMEVLSKARGNQNGHGLIALPGGQAVRLNLPSAQELALMNLEATRIVMQSLRILLFAVNDIDTRIRNYQAATTNDRPDRQDQTDSAEPLAQGGSQSPGAAQDMA
jgi:hypothetical protein